MIRINSSDLANLIQTCFDLSGEGTFSDAQRKAWLAVGKRLRGALINMLTAQFDDGTQKVLDANTELKRINKDLKAAVASMDKLKDELAAAKALVGTLDSLLGVAAAFV